MLKWACIGVGKYSNLRGGVNAIAYAHAEAMKRNAGSFELVASASLEQENLDNFAREYPSRGYLDMNELFAREKLDGCTISTWAPAREEHVLAAIGAGVRNILIEKPLSLTMAAADRMKAAADKAGARLFVNFQRRYGRPFELAREAVQSGKLGAVVSIDLAQPCSNALDFGPHFINAALFILGNPAPKAVLAGAEGLASVPWHGMKVESRMTATVYLDGGVRLDYSAMPENSWDAPVIRVNGTRGFCELWTNKPVDAKSVFRVVTGSGEDNPALDETSITATAIRSCTSSAATATSRRQLRLARRAASTSRTAMPRRRSCLQCTSRRRRATLWSSEGGRWNEVRTF